MKEIGNGLKKIFRKEKGLLLMMIVLLILGVVLILHTFLHFKAGATTMYLGYSKIGEFGGDYASLWSSGGYRTGGWAEMSVFPLLGLCLGFLHNLFTVQIYTRKGKGYAYVFLILSLFVAVQVFIYLLKMLGEL